MLVSYVAVKSQKPLVAFETLSSFYLMRPILWCEYEYSHKNHSDFCKRSWYPYDIRCRLYNISWDNPRRSFTTEKVALSSTGSQTTMVHPTIVGLIIQNPPEKGIAVRTTNPLDRTQVRENGAGQQYFYFLASCWFYKATVWENGGHRYLFGQSDLSVREA